eukprot:c29812_g1_i1 orf=64-324(-)
MPVIKKQLCMIQLISQESDKIRKSKTIHSIYKQPRSISMEQEQLMHAHYIQDCPTRLNIACKAYVTLQVFQVHQSSISHLPSPYFG